MYLMAIIEYSKPSNIILCLPPNARENPSSMFYPSKQTNIYLKEVRKEIILIGDYLKKTYAPTLQVIDMTSVVKMSTLHDGLHPDKEGAKAIATAVNNAITGGSTPNVQ
jgi:lysophospholipase L1-like esterase